jgi:hypothetical protein
MPEGLIIVGLSRDEVPQWANLAISTAKFVLTVIWDVSGFRVLDLIPSHCGFDWQYIVERNKIYRKAQLRMERILIALNLRQIILPRFALIVHRRRKIMLVR